MNCENVYCIYCNNGVCKLGNISLDIQGKCTACIMVELSEDILDKHKQKQLEEYSVLDDIM